MLSKRIAERRKFKNLSQTELARLLGVARSTVAMWESGEREPGVDATNKLADILDTSVDYLYGRIHESTKDIGTSPSQNPLGIELTEEQVQLLREMRDDPNGILMFYDYASATEEEKRMMLEIWASIRKSSKRKQKDE